MPKSTKKKKEKVADFSVIISFATPPEIPLTLFDQTESEAETWKREEATDECRGHDVQSAMYAF